MTINLSPEQQRLFKSVTDQEFSNTNQTAIPKTREYLFEMAEMCVLSDEELQSLKHQGFEHVAERLVDLENALNIHDVAKTAN